MTSGFADADLDEFSWVVSLAGCGTISCGDRADSASATYTAPASILGGTSGRTPERGDLLHRAVVYRNAGET